MSSCDHSGNATEGVGVSWDNDKGTPPWSGAYATKDIEPLLPIKFASNPIREDAVNHPSHYGGDGNPFEAIKVIEAWGLGFNLGNTVKYISRAGKKGGNSTLQDLRKSLWYLQREISRLEKAQEDVEGS